MNINAINRQMSKNLSAKGVATSVVQADGLRKKAISKAKSSKKSKTTREILEGLASDVTDKNFLYNDFQARTTRDWEEMMSNTSHQREVADLKAAGLNPVLSANSGAMAYTGATASGSAADPTSALASIYDRKLANKNNLSVTKLNTRNALNIAKLNYKSTKYASDRGLEQAKTTASATRYAAGANAAATQAAAAANAAATRAAAAESAAATRYAADQSAAANKYKTDETKGGTWPGLLSNLADYTKKSTFLDKMNDLANSYMKKPK